MSPRSSKPHGTSQSPGMRPGLVTISPTPSYAFAEHFLPDAIFDRSHVRARFSRHRRGGALRRAGLPGITDRPRVGSVPRRLRGGDPAPTDARPARISRFG